MEHRRKTVSGRVDTSLPPDNNPYFGLPGIGAPVVFNSGYSQIALTGTVDFGVLFREIVSTLQHIP